MACSRACSRCSVPCFRIVIPLNLGDRSLKCREPRGEVRLAGTHGEVQYRRGCAHLGVWWCRRREVALKRRDGRRRDLLQPPDRVLEGLLSRRPVARREVGVSEPSAKCAYCQSHLRCSLLDGFLKQQGRDGRLPAVRKSTAVPSPNHLRLPALICALEGGGCKRGLSFRPEDHGTDVAPAALGPIARSLPVANGSRAEPGETRT